MNRPTMAPSFWAMPFCVRSPGIAAGLALAVSLACGPAAAAPARDTVVFAPHRAVYDLTLVRSRGTRDIDSVRGRIVYDFSGSACEGYTLQFRQVAQHRSRDGDGVLSDLRSTTWEDAAARKFRFSSESRVNDKVSETVDGHADRRAKAVSVMLSKPKARKIAVPVRSVFPTEHMRRIVLAARAGTNVLEFPVFDGTDDGQKVYNTLTVIGRPIAPGEAAPQDAAANVPELAALTRWPVTISYFETLSKADARKGEQTPTYAVAFELYENGISRALTLDYPDFRLSGKMTALEMKKAKPCK